jgi:hypothetical protein
MGARFSSREASRTPIPRNYTSMQPRTFYDCVYPNFPACAAAGLCINWWVFFSYKSVLEDREESHNKPFK